MIEQTNGWQQNISRQVATQWFDSGEKLQSEILWSY